MNTTTGGNTMKFTHGQPIEHGVACPFSVVDILAQEYGTRLERVGAGARIAGSIRAYQDAHYRVRFEMDGATHGRAHKTLEAARAHYDQRIQYLRSMRVHEVR